MNPPCPKCGVPMLRVGRGLRCGWSRCSTRSFVSELYRTLKTDSAKRWGFPDRIYTNPFPK